MHNGFSSYRKSQTGTRTYAYLCIFCIQCPGVAGACGAVMRAQRYPLHLMAWLTPRHLQASKPCPVGELLADPLPFKRGVVLLIIATPSTSLVTASSLFSLPPAPVSGMRAGSGESLSQPLGWPPSQGPPRHVIPDEAAALPSRTSPAPRLR